MIAAQRQREILNDVIVNGIVSVVDLSGRYDVTEETIRRDLDKLEETKRIRRTHGGAVVVEQGREESPHWRRELLNRPEKEAIAKEAASLIQDGDTIMIDASSTSYYLATHLPDKNLIVITNSSKVAQALAGHGNVKVICLGGTLSPESLSFIGPHAERMLDEVHAEKCFLSCGSLDESLALSDTNELQAALRRKFLERSERHYLMADHTKFGKPLLARFGTLEPIDVVITDSQTPEALQREVRKHVDVVRVVSTGQADTVIL